MRKYLAIIVILLVSAFAIAAINDVPKNHWAYEAVTQLEEAGIITGYPDGTFRGTSNVTRYELAVFLARTMNTIESELGEIIKNRYLNSLRLISANKDQLDALYKVVKDVSNAIDELEMKVAKLEEATKDLENLKITVDIHEGDITTLYGITGDLKKDVAVLKNKTSNLSEISTAIDKLNKALDIHDKDIIKIYEELTKKATKKDVESVVNTSLENVNGQIEFLYKKIAKTEEDVKAYTDEKLVEVKGKVANIEANVNDAIPMLRNLVYQNASNIKNLEKKLVKLIGVKVKSIDNKINEVNEIATFNSDTLNGLAMKLGEVEYSLRKQIEKVQKSVDQAALKSDVENLTKVVETKADKTDVETLGKKVDSVNTLSIIGIVLGAVGLGIAIYAGFLKTP
ncbi:S-layer homology domain-containing protein [Thermosipho ferrireducens]|uniref:S-layer homology domain-containing protein n=1 Tax=Thermosipho ferrireducens TaxID=2571116 RepID=A0ABX7S4E5_9BACT|nr:S-layer homology domain-containing protein [Thermosipho ferrireducens]QTA37316.1 S-layer homology domain-containing protein [Thermosipho ferrireducens]